jgi:murein tripeptide amidase MpaA
VHYAIANAASEASFPQAWPGTWVCFTEAIHDKEAWQRQTDTKYEDGKLTWTHSHSKNGSVYFTFYPLFTYQRHLELISKCSLYADVQSLGQTLQGREIDLVTVGTGERVCWVFHRQHPGESMASWYAEGFLTRLLGLDRNGEVDGLVYHLLQMYTFYIVPMMCPDGVVLGHIRVNSVGANLNREWGPRGTEGDSDFYEAPTLQRSPEVWYVLNKMDETGVDIALDIHGDEELVSPGNNDHAALSKCILTLSFPLYAALQLHCWW